MDNIIFEKIYEEIENDFIELKITGISEYVQAYQTCYVGNEFLALCGKRIRNGRKFRKTLTGYCRS